jgi:hypothetical protein
MLSNENVVTMLVNESRDFLKKENVKKKKGRKAKDARVPNQALPAHGGT